MTFFLFGRTLKQDLYFYFNPVNNDKNEIRFIRILMSQELNNLKSKLFA